MKNLSSEVTVKVRRQITDWSERKTVKVTACNSQLATRNSQPVCDAVTGVTVTILAACFGNEEKRKRTLDRQHRN